MASEVRSTGPAVGEPDPGVADAILAEPYTFEFFQAVRVLERAYPGRKPVGYFEDPRSEVVRFRALNSLAFPPSEVAAIEAPSESASGVAEMTVAFMGLTGPIGALPLHYTALLADPATRKNVAAVRDFLDIFNHRFVSFFYRAWEKYRFPVAFERGERDTFSGYLFSLIGLGTAGLQDRMSFADRTLLYYSGLLAQRPRSAAALAAILGDFFEVPLDVVQFTGQWFLMNPDTLTGLGMANNQLGITTVLWERIFDPAARFRIVLGPMSYEAFAEFLPDGQGYRRLVDLTRFFAGDDLGFEVEPRLQPDEIPRCSLGQDPRSRLGWSMWMKTGDLDDTVSQPRFAAHTAEQIGQEVTNL